MVKPATKTSTGFACGVVTPRGATSRGAIVFCERDKGHRLGRDIKVFYEVVLHEGLKKEYNPAEVADLYIKTGGPFVDPNDYYVDRHIHFRENIRNRLTCQG